MTKNPTHLSGDVRGPRTIRKLTEVSCAFCGIVSGNRGGHPVLDEPELIAVLDHRPVFKGHVLLLPRTHIPTLLQLPADMRDRFLEATQRLARAMEDGLGAGGSFVATNNKVSQSVPHLHTHVVPRTKGDGLRGFFWPRTRYADEQEMVEYAQRLRNVLTPPS